MNLFIGAYLSSNKNIPMVCFFYHSLLKYAVLCAYCCGMICLIWICLYRQWARVETAHSVNNKRRTDTTR